MLLFSELTDRSKKTLRVAARAKAFTSRSGGAGHALRLNCSQSPVFRLGSKPPRTEVLRFLQETCAPNRRFGPGLPAPAHPAPHSGLRCEYSHHVMLDQCDSPILFVLLQVVLRGGAEQS